MVPHADMLPGGVSCTYDNDSARFVFDGGDSDVVVPSVLFFAVAAIQQGTVKVEVPDGTSVVAGARFLPNQSVVSAGMSNGGLGCGFVPGGIGASGLGVSRLHHLRAALRAGSGPAGGGPGGGHAVHPQAPAATARGLNR